MFGREFIGEFQLIWKEFRSRAVKNPVFGLWIEWQ